MTAPEVQHILGRYELGQIQSVRFLGNAGGFSGARLWKIECDRGRFCLRRWPKNPAVDVAFIHRVLKSAEEAELPVAAPITNRDFRTLVSDSAGAEWEVAIWVDGVADFNQNPSLERLDDAVRTLARFHQVTTEAPCAGLSDALRFRLSKLEEAPQLLSRLADVLANEEGELAHVARQLIPRLEYCVEPLRQKVKAYVDQAWPMVCAIRDIHHDHLFFQDQQLSGIVDFGAMKIEARSFDLARMIGSLKWKGGHPWEESLAIYSELNSLERDEVDLVYAMHECNVSLGIVNWLSWIFLERRQFEDWNAVKIRINCLVEEFGC